MEAHHVKTREPSPYDIFGEHFELHSLNILGANILIGYSPDNKKKKGNILNYPCPSIYSSRLLQLVNGDTSIKGDIISIIDLDEETISKIRVNYNPLLERGEKVYHIGRKVTLKEDFDGSTDYLIAILSSQPREGKSRWFRKPAEIWDSVLRHNLTH